MINRTKQELIDFEKRIADLFEQAKIPYLLHLCGGNEEQLIKIFREIREGDYIFSTHRSHYHYLLAGGSLESLERKILNGKSMFVFDRNLNFLSSSIVAGAPCIAAGVALALKRKESDKKVWCFVGDGAEDEGHFYEAVRYVDGWDLPCTFVIEDNDRSVDSPKRERYGKSKMEWPKCVKRYEYIPTYPHAGTGGKLIDLSKNPPKIPPQREKVSSIININNINPSSEISYKDVVKKSMEMLAKESNSIFIGYNVNHGCAYGTLKDVSPSKKIETPLAENLMTGLAIGMSLEGYKPIVFFERHDFLLDGLDAIVNHMDKIETLSDSQFNVPVTIKAIVGAQKPIYAGITHTQDFTKSLREMVFFPVYDPKNADEVLWAYEKAKSSKSPVMVVERRELY